MRDDGAIRRASADLSLIRLQLLRSATFRGYRTLTVGMSGAVGITTAVLQAQFVPHPSEQTLAFIGLWSAAAVLCLAAASVDILVELRGTPSTLLRTLTKQAIGYFLPTLVLGGGVTIAVLGRYLLAATEAVSLLPGIWALLFSLGCFASAPVLPRVAVLSGCWYGIAGILAVFWHDSALHPLCMGLVFGVGQLLTMLWLYFFLERRHGA